VPCSLAAIIITPRLIESVETLRMGLRLSTLSTAKSAEIEPGGPGVTRLPQWLLRLALD
jgi:hypothetical protein